MKNKLVLLNILLPPIICLTIITIAKIGIDYYPLSFGLIIGIVNWRHYRCSPYLGIIISLFVSYLAFFIAYASLPLFVEFFKLFNISNREVLPIVLSSFIIAPILVFMFYKYVFLFKKNKRTTFIILCSITLLVIIFCTHVWYHKLTMFKYEFNEALNPYTLWQVIMALSIQIIINQDFFIREEV